jgi:trehalose 6-phosphate synthase
LAKDIVETGKGEIPTLRYAGRDVRIGVFPIGIDANAHVKQCSDERVLEETHRLHATHPDRQLILGIDRLDYTKGIPHRLEAFRRALLRYPEMHNKVTLIQVVVPSREDIPEYHDLRMEIEHLVGQINGQFTRPGGWVPIHYIFRSLDKSELLAYYRASEIALITPLKDGMNLVAKEYYACSIDEDSVLILSEFAGAAAQLQSGALLVNPHDVEGVADAIYTAFRLSPEDRRARMRRMRRSIFKYDIYWWANAFLKAAISKDLEDFPIPEDYVYAHETNAGLTL